MDKAENSQSSAYPIELGAKVDLALDSPCETYISNLKCGLTDGYIEVTPFLSSFHYKQSCANGHFVKHVRRSEIELKLGIKHERAKVRRHLLDPADRVGFNVLLRAKWTCVYGGEKAGEKRLDGTDVIVEPDHIIPKALINLEDLARDKELLMFTRDVQLVAACRQHNLAKGTMLLPIDDALETFVGHVLKGERGGKNVGHVSKFERLYRLAEKTLRTKTKPN